MAPPLPPAAPVLAFLETPLCANAFYRAKSLQILARRRSKARDNMRLDALMIYALFVRQAGKNKPVSLSRSGGKVTA